MRNPSGKLPPMVRLLISVANSVVAIFLVFSICILYASTASAVNPDEVLSDPVLEKRARNLSTNLRCLVCQNQSIDDSDASLAKDLRVLLRKRLVAGDSDDQVIDYIVSRYGEFVLLKPRFGAHTLVLWSLPVVLILLGILIALFKVRNRRGEETVILSSEETARITKLLDKGD